jgi:hypothetical protein
VPSQLLLLLLLQLLLLLYLLLLLRWLLWLLLLLHVVLLGMRVRCCCGRCLLLRGWVVLLRCRHM